MRAACNLIMEELFFFRDIKNTDHSVWPTSKFGLFINIWGDKEVNDFINDVSLFKGHLAEVKFSINFVFLVNLVGQFQINNPITINILSV